MAEPLDSTFLLEDALSITQTQYMPKYEEEYPDRFGLTTNRFFTPAEKPVVGVGAVMQAELSPTDTTRTDTDPLGPFAAPDQFQATSLTARFSKTNPAANDFTSFSASAQVDDIDLQIKGAGSIVDYCERIYSQTEPDYKEKLAIFRNIPRSGQLALVNGTPTLNNSYYSGGATSTATNTGGARVVIDNGSLAYFKEGRRLDFLNPTTFVVNAGNVRVTDINVADNSIGIVFNTTGMTSALSTGNLANVADNDLIVMSGTYGKGMYSMGAYMGRPTAGESFIGGVDRTTSGYRWLLPVATREGVTAAPITKSMFDDMAIAMIFKGELPKDLMAVVTYPTLEQALRTQIGEDGFFQLPLGDSRADRFMNFGSMGLNYQHSQFGTMKIMADPLHPSTSCDFFANGTWTSLHYGWKGLRAMPSGYGGRWYRMPEAAPNSGLGKMWKADFYSIQTDWCNRPWQNGRILNVTAT